MSSGKRRSKSTALIGVILVVVTVAVFFLVTKEREAVALAGLFFLLAAEIIPVAGLIGIDRAAERSHGVMVRSGGAGILLLYGIAAAVAAVIFIVVAGSSVFILAAVELVFLALAAIVLIVILTAGKSAASHDGGTMAAVSEMRALSDMARMLVENPANEPYGKKLREIYESLRYCDFSHSVETDDVIGDRLKELEAVLAQELEEESEKQERVSRVVEEISHLIRRRTVEVKNLKRGGI